MKSSGFRYCTVAYKDTDLWIGVDEKSYATFKSEQVLAWIKEIRFQLESYIAEHREFLTSLQPVKVKKNAPRLVKEMASAGFRADVGPMAAVAGAFSYEIGRLLKKDANEVLVENGGDLYLDAARDITVGIYAGESPLSGKVGVKVPYEKMPLGVCTSAGTVGHSLSLGKADAVMVISSSPLIADAFATAIGNKVVSAKDIKNALEWAKSFTDVTGVVIIIEDKMGVWGDIDLVSL